MSAVAPDYRGPNPHIQINGLRKKAWKSAYSRVLALESRIGLEHLTCLFRMLYKIFTYPISTFVFEYLFYPILPSLLFQTQH